MAVTTLGAAITALQALVKANLTEMRDAPANAPGQIPAYPYCVAFPDSGDWTHYAGWKKGVQTIIVQLHFDRSDQARAIAQAMPYADSFPNLMFKNPSLSGTVDTIVEQIQDKFGVLEWNGVQTIGWEFRVTVKLQTGVT